jgi:3-hydroxybutyryl-CoA dehydrogenase
MMFLNEAPVLIVGDDELAVSIGSCLLLAGQAVSIYTTNHAGTLSGINELCPASDLSRLNLVSDLSGEADYAMAIAITPENLKAKKTAINFIEKNLSGYKMLAINSESIGLDELQQGTRYPGRIIGANWVLPAQTTYFLEVIFNQVNAPQLIHDFCNHARQHWKKDPYILPMGFGIRSRLMCALIREAFYLVENGYVSVEDIDRACRNDAGYYLPFAGNFRYMDLMGTYLYGLVMEEMNPDLSTGRTIPAFFTSLLENGHSGMTSGKGMYDYADGEDARWRSLSDKFNTQIRTLMEKYPFNYLYETEQTYNS